MGGMHLELYTVYVEDISKTYLLILKSILLFLIISDIIFFLYHLSDIYYFHCLSHVMSLVVPQQRLLSCPLLL